NLIEAVDIDEAVRIAAEFPWAETGCIEVRPVRDMEAVRRRVGA
ncbi:MAG TPA: YciI family protein, partial [Pseudoxanthomonas sp.]|nr:YciI family protein [Pseudoxanthomonas sp.]